MTEIQQTNWEDFTNNLTITRRPDNRPQKLDCEISIDEPRLNSATGVYELNIDIDSGGDRGMSWISLNREQVIQLKDFLVKCLDNKSFK